MKFKFRSIFEIIPLFILALLLLMACTDEDKANTDAEILAIELINSNIDNFKIEKLYKDSDNGVLMIIPNIPVPKGYDSVKLQVNIELSNGAELQKTLSNLWFGSPDDEQLCTVVAENGDTKDWIIKFIGNQLPNAHFEYWHEVIGMDGNPFWQPGRNEHTPWATANFGTSIYGVYGAIKFPEGDGTQVKIKTSETSAIPIMAGTIFTGTFSVEMAINNPTNPKMATLMGVPFGLRPDTMRITYRYSPGDKLIKATPNSNESIFSGFTVEELTGTDECSIYAVLERRDGDEVVEVGRAEFASSKKILRVITIDIPFNYTDNSTPTHIYFVATSSKEGDAYKGAVGSTLIIDDLEFIYE